MRVWVGLAVAAVLGMAGLTQASQVDMKQVSADAKWAAHLDVDALMASKSMQKVREQIIKDHPNAESALAMIKTVWRFDPRTDLHGVTVYGTQLKKDTGVAIIRAKVDQKFLLDLVKLTPEYKTEKYGKYDLHTWVQDGKKHNSTFFQDDVLVFSPSVDELKAALDVLDGTKPNFTTKTPGSTPMLPPGTILAAGAHGLGEADLPCHSPLSKQADVAWVFIGENQGEVFVRGALKVKDAEIAKKLKAVADGALALASLSKMDDADALKLIDAVKVTLADKVISVEAQAPVDAVWAQIQKEHAKKMSAMGAHGRDKVMKHIHDHFQGK
jgi:hypothetical protein